MDKPTPTPTVTPTPTPTSTLTPTSTTTTNSSPCEEGQFCFDASLCNGGECKMVNLYGFCKCDNITTTTSISTPTPTPTPTSISTSTTTTDSSPCDEGLFCSDDSDCNGGKCGSSGLCKCDNIITTTSISTPTPTPTSISTSTTTTDSSSCKEGHYCFDDYECNGGECKKGNPFVNGACKCDNITTTTLISTPTPTPTDPTPTPTDPTPTPTDPTPTPTPTPSTTPKVDYGMRFCLIKVKKARKTKRSSNINIKSNINIDIFPCDPDETCEKDAGTCYKPGLDAG